MRIGVDASSVIPGQSAGVEEFTYGLLSGMAATAQGRVMDALVASGSVAAWRARVPNPQLRWSEVRVPLARESKIKSVLLRMAPQAVRSSNAARWAVNVVRGVPFGFRSAEEPDVRIYPFHRTPARNGRYMVTVHDLRVFEAEFASNADRAVIARNVEGASAVVASWPHPYNGILDRFPEAAEKTFLVSLPAFNSKPDTYPRAPQANLLVYPSSTGEHKNQAVLLDALAMLPEYRLICIGPLLEPRATALQRRVVKLRLGDRVTFTGFVDTACLQAWLAKADFIVAPTLWEAASGAVFEAFSWGIPVCCSDIPPLRAQVAFVDGLVEYFDPHDPNSVVRSLHRAASRREELTDASRRAGQRLKERTWEQVATDYWEIASWISNGAAAASRPVALQPTRRGTD